MNDLVPNYIANHCSSSGNEGASDAFGNYDTKLRTSDPSQVDENFDTMSSKRSLTDETSSEGLFKSKGYVKQTNTGKEKLMSLP